MTALGTLGPLVATAANRPVALTAANQVQNLTVVAQISWASEDGKAKTYQLLLIVCRPIAYNRFEYVDGYIKALWHPSTKIAFGCGIVSGSLC